jgi:hypothetical protein
VTEQRPALGRLASAAERPPSGLFDAPGYPLAEIAFRACMASAGRFAAVELGTLLNRRSYQPGLTFIGRPKREPR